MTRPRDARLRDLAAAHASITAHPLGDGYVAAVAYNAAGELELVEVLNRDGVRLPDEQAAARLAAARLRAQVLLDAATAGLVAHLALRQARGEEVNMSALARDAGLGSRQTLYNWLADVDVAPGA